jgi:hypothetical protein
VEATLETAEKEIAENDEPVKRLSEQELFAVAGGREPQRTSGGPCQFTAQTCQANTYACANNPFCNPDARRRLSGIVSGRLSRAYITGGLVRK